MSTCSSSIYPTPFPSVVFAGRLALSCRASALFIVIKVQFARYGLSRSPLAAYTVSDTHPHQNKDNGVQRLTDALNAKKRTVGLSVALATSCPHGAPFGAMRILAYIVNYLFSYRAVSIAKATT